MKAGFTISGTQKYKCKNCGKIHNPTPKKNGYSEEEKTEALRYYYEGNSGRSTGRFFKMSKANAVRWIKERAEKEKNMPDETLAEECEAEELDEVYHFIESKKKSIRDDSNNARSTANWGLSSGLQQWERGITESGRQRT